MTYFAILTNSGEKTFLERELDPDLQLHFVLGLKSWLFILFFSLLLFTKCTLCIINKINKYIVLKIACLASYSLFRCDLTHDLTPLTFEL